MMSRACPYLTPGRAGSAQLAVRVQPGARSEGVRWTAAGLLVRSMAPPREGEANEDVVRQVAAALGVAKSGVSVVSGHKSRDKHVSVPLRVEDALARLQPLWEEDER